MILTHDGELTRRVEAILKYISLEDGSEDVMFKSLTELSEALNETEDFIHLSLHLLMELGLIVEIRRLSYGRAITDKGRDYLNPED